MRAWSTFSIELMIALVSSPEAMPEKEIALVSATLPPPLSVPPTGLVRSGQDHHRQEFRRH